MNQVYQMVREHMRRGKTVYLCEICRLGYRDLETAERCEQHCYSHASCSLEITRKAVYKPSVQVMSIPS